MSIDLTQLAVAFIYLIMLSGCQASDPHGVGFLSATPSEKSAMLTPTLTKAPTSTLRPRDTSAINPTLTMTHVPTPIISTSKIMEVDGDRLNSFALREDGRLYAWGWAQSITPNASRDEVVPSPILMTDVYDIASIETETQRLFLNKNGEILYLNKGLMSRVGELDDVIEVRSWANAIVALRADGVVWLTNDVEFGDTVTMNHDFTESPLTDVTAIETMPGRVFAVKADGSLWQWGNENDPLRVGSTVPQRVEVPKKITSVTYGFNLLMIYEDGTLGYWDQEWIKDGWYIVQKSIPELGPVVEVDGDHGSSALFLLEDGTVYGIGAASLRNDPPYGLFDTLTRIIDISHVGNHNFALDKVGTVWAWGTYNNVGQLGTGAVGDYQIYPPVPIIVSEP